MRWFSPSTCHLEACPLAPDRFALAEAGETPSLLRSFVRLCVALSLLISSFRSRFAEPNQSSPRLPAAPSTNPLDVFIFGPRFPYAVGTAVTLARNGGRSRRPARLVLPASLGGEEDGEDAREADVLETTRGPGGGTGGGGWDRGGGRTRVRQTRKQGLWVGNDRGARRWDRVAQRREVRGRDRASRRRRRFSFD